MVKSSMRTPEQDVVQGRDLHSESQKEVLRLSSVWPALQRLS